MASLAVPSNVQPFTNTSSSNPIIKQQQELYFSKYNENMSTEQTNNLIERIIILQQLYFQDTIIQSQYNDIEFWESISDGLHVSKHTKPNTADDNKNNNDATRTNQHRNKDNILSLYAPNPPTNLLHFYGIHVIYDHVLEIIMIIYMVVMEMTRLMVGMI